MKTNSQKGFTLVELMIALFLSGILLAGLGVAFKSQQDVYIAQEEVAEMQQEIRAGLEIMLREIRNAGHDIDPAKLTAGVGFSVAGPFQIQFAMDLTGSATGDPDGDILDANENVAYRLSTDVDANGITDAGALDQSLGRDTGGGLQPLTNNIHALGFAYAYDSNGDGVLETKVVGGTNSVIWAVPNAAGTTWVDLDNNGDGIIDANDADPLPATIGLADATRRSQIRAVRIWILARVSRADRSYTDTNTYKVGVNRINAPNDNFRRRLLTANVRCRNMGIPATP
ncbi:MAG: PilW family protein [Pseudomonadota bacterium]